MHRRLVLIFAIFVAVLAAASLGTLIAVTRDRPQASPTPSPSLSVAPSAGHTALPTPSATTTSRPPVSPTTMPAPTATRPSTPTAPPGPTAVPDHLIGRDIERIPTSHPVVALTFDAGANGDGLASILSTLSAQQVSATFFLTGDFAARNPAAVRAIVARGHRLGNHSATHPYFTSLSDAAIRTELDRARTAIRAAGGTDPRPLFRFPYGDRNARTIGAVNAAGYASVRWTVDTLGWQGVSGGITVQPVVDRVMDSAGPGEIVLMHVGSHPTDRSTLDADALPTVITRLRASGYRFVTLDALL